MGLRGLLDALFGFTAIPVLGLGLLTRFRGDRWFWMVVGLGFTVVVPAVAILSVALVTSAPAGTDLPEEDALAVLRDRYARGENDETEAEAELESERA